MKGDQFEPSVCVIIPMFNAAATIGKALESLAQQTRLPDRVIVVDDGSTDNSAQTVERLTFPYELLLIQQKTRALRPQGMPAYSAPMRRCWLFWMLMTIGFRKNWKNR